MRHCLEAVFPEVVPLLDARLHDAWVDAGLPRDVLERAGNWPSLSFSAWVGGDRDGHPLVTADVTAETLLEFRSRAIALIARRLSRLARALSSPTSCRCRPRRWPAAYAN